MQINVVGDSVSELAANELLHDYHSHYKTQSSIATCYAVVYQHYSVVMITASMLAWVGLLFSQ